MTVENNTITDGPATAGVIVAPTCGVISDNKVVGSVGGIWLGDPE